MTIFVYLTFNCDIRNSCNVLKYYVVSQFRNGSLSPMDLNQGDLLGSIFAEVDSVKLVADSVELEAEVDSVVLFRHSSSSSTAMTHLQLNVRKPSLFLKDIYSILLA